jgi:hypothetical protein
MRPRRRALVVNRLRDIPRPLLLCPVQARLELLAQGSHLLRQIPQPCIDFAYDVAVVHCVCRLAIRGRQPDLLVRLLMQAECHP